MSHKALFYSQYSKFLKCFHDKMTDLPSCNEKKVTVMTDFLKSQATNAMDMLCGDYTDDSDKCAALGMKFKVKDFVIMIVHFHC